MGRSLIEHILEGRDGKGAEPTPSGSDHERRPSSPPIKKGERGQAVILVIFVLVVFLIFFFVLIDFARVYYVRGQLQNAVDAAALAGAGLLDGSNDLVQLPVREEAWKFACKNVAANRHVFLVDDSTDCANPPAQLNQSNNANGDIVLGNWDGTAFTAGGTPVNAVLALGKFMEDAPYNGGEAPLIFGFLIGQPTMGIQRVAIAQRPARAEAPIALCTNTCDPSLFAGGPIDVYLAPTKKEQEEQGALGVAWTVFTDKQPTTPKLISFICDRRIGGDCHALIDTAQGFGDKVAREFRCAFLNPKYDSANKTCTGGTTAACGDEASDVVTKWEVIVPIVDECPPGVQGHVEPYEIIDWGLATITEVFAQGGRNGTGVCECDPDFFYTKLEPGGTNIMAIRLSMIECVECDPPPDFLARTPSLVH